MRKKTALCLALCLAAALLCGCTAAPPDAVIRSEPERSQLISANTETLEPDAFRAVLYFRYGQTAYLAPEERIVKAERNETAEMALVQALIAGPSATSSSLSPLFPPGTEVLSVSAQEDTLYVTFSEALLGRYADEPSDPSSEPWKTEGALRRRLCMDALTAALTEAGLCARVQVLVYRETAQTASMRLQAGFFDRGGDETPLSPLTRNEDSLLTPHNTARLLLQAWMNRSWVDLYDLVSRNTRPGEQTAFNTFDTARPLTDFAVSAGTVSLDGQRAVLCADLTTQASGQAETLGGYPLRLTRSDGLWRMDYSELTAMLCQ